MSNGLVAKSRIEFKLRLGKQQLDEPTLICAFGVSQLSQPPVQPLHSTLMISLGAKV